jgi:hypothetical protein
MRAFAEDDGEVSVEELDLSAVPRVTGEESAALLVIVTLRQAQLSRFDNG